MLTSTATASLSGGGRLRIYCAIRLFRLPSDITLTTSPKFMSRALPSRTKFTKIIDDDKIPLCSLPVLSCSHSQQNGWASQRSTLNAVLIIHIIRDKTTTGVNSILLTIPSHKKKKHDTSSAFSLTLSTLPSFLAFSVAIRSSRSASCPALSSYAARARARSASRGARDRRR
jgi:hypothetical protein